jgi:beta-catenin-like protein 1
MLRRKSKSLQDIVEVLRVYRDNIDEEETPPEETAPSQREILEGLITFLEGCES